MYSICGLIIPQSEEAHCAELKLPCVRLEERLSLIPLDGSLFLTDGDSTERADGFAWTAPQWLLDLAVRFSRCAYIEAEFWGGAGAQASVAWEQGRIVFGPEISPGAINTALRKLWIHDEPSAGMFGLSLATGPDPFERVGLGRHVSVAEWRRACARSTDARDGSFASGVSNPGGAGTGQHVVARAARLRAGGKDLVKELEKNQRVSAGAIRVYPWLLLGLAAALWMLGRLFPIPSAVTIIVLGIPAFSLVMDLMNYLHCRRKLRALKHDPAS